MPTEANNPRRKALRYPLRKAWADTRCLKRDAPSVGSTWHSLTGPIEWGAGLREHIGNPGRAGWFDFEHKIRLVRRPYQESMAEWSPLMSGSRQ